MFVTLVYLEKDLTLNLQVQPDLTLENFRAICSVEVGIPSDKIVFVHNGRTLTGDSSTLASHNVKENDVIAVHPTSSPFQMQGRPPGMPRIDFGAIRMPNQATSSRQQSSSNAQGGWDMNDPEALRRRFLNSPHDLALLSERNPAFADAIRKGGEAFAKHLEKVRDAQAEAERHRIRLLAADPMDPEAQREIAEEIRQKNIQENMNMAIEEAPESFGQVLMLWINIKVNGHSVKAFVDSGAQMTIMSSKCAENCNIMRLVDKRWEGIAKGVGTQKIIGRIHLAQMQIENDYLQCSFSVLENQPMDVLLGLDMLRRHQCCIDLKSNTLKIGTTGTETRFLHESELPTQNRLHTPSNDEAASTSTMETEDEQIAKALRESSKEAMESESTGEGNASGQKFPESDIKALTDMGLNRASAEAELQRCGGDVQRAIVKMLARSLKPQ